MTTVRRKKGIKWENFCVKWLNTYSVNTKNLQLKLSLKDLPERHFTIFPKLGSTRALDKKLDSRKVDITTFDPKKLTEFGYLIQNKSLIGGCAPYPKLLMEMREVADKLNCIPVIFHEQTKTVKIEDKIRTDRKGIFAALYLDNFIDMMVEIKQLKIKLRKYER